MQALHCLENGKSFLLTTVESLCAWRSNWFGVEDNVTVKESFVVFYTENTGI